MHADPPQDAENVTTSRPVHRVEPHTRPFFEAAANCRFVLPGCRSCGRFAQPGASVCSHCLGDELDWRAASGRGRIYSYVVFHRSFHPAFKAPYGVCIIELEEGPRLVGEVVDIELVDLHVDLPVTVIFSPTSDGDGPPLRFRPDRMGGRGKHLDPVRDRGSK